MNEEDKEAKDDIRCLSEDIIKLEALKDAKDEDWSDHAYNGLINLIENLQDVLRLHKVNFYDEHIEKKKV